MITRSRRQRKQQIIENVLEGDLREELEKVAGTSLVSVNRRTSNSDKCTEINKKHFREGCVPFHSSQYTEKPSNEHISLLERCLQRVHNDPRCVGGQLYRGKMRKKYWLEEVEIPEKSVAQNIFELIPERDEYEKLQENGESDGIRLGFVFKQRLEGEYVMMRIIFTIDDFDNISCAAYDDTNENLLYNKDYTFEEMHRFVNDMITKTFVDVDSGNNRILRIKGKHIGQKILLSERTQECHILLLKLKRY
tara:strand:- start:225 stop:974 length:750 start_codon:yes stop_codon:yes gene_type:complete